MILGWNTSTYEVLTPEALTDATTQVGTERFTERLMGCG